MDTESGLDTPTAQASSKEQRDIAQLCLATGILLLQHGAESALVDSVATRLGVALGMDGVEVGILGNAVSVTTIRDEHAVTLVRRSLDRGINMHFVTETQRAVLAVEAGQLDRESFRARIHSIPAWRYPRWMVALAIGLSCACFCRLARADLAACLVTFAASTLGMVTRQVLVSRHFNPHVTFFISAFVATSVAGQAVIYQLGTTPKLAMASCVLFLVPGFPMINAVSDAVKGYSHTAVARAVVAIMLGGATAGGVLLAMTVWRVWGWL